MTEQTIAPSYSFGEWVRARRLERKLGLEEAAERAGWKHPRWAHIESKRSRRKGGEPTQPTVETVKKVAMALGVSEAEALLAAGYAPASMVLFGEQEHNRMALFSAEEEASPEQLARTINNLSGLVVKMGRQIDSLISEVQTLRSEISQKRGDREGEV